MWEEHCFLPVCILEIKICDLPTSELIFYQAVEVQIEMESEFFLNPKTVSHTACSLFLIMSSAFASLSLSWKKNFQK